MNRYFLLCLPALAVWACGVEPVDLTGRECPCAAGWQCDATSNRCVEVVPDASVDSGGAGGSDGGSDAGPDVSLDAGPDVVDSGPPPLFGRDCVGDQVGGMSKDRKRASRYVLLEDGLFEALVIYVEGSTSATEVQPFRGVVYSSDPVTGEPTELVAETEEVSVQPSQAKAWVTLPFASPQALSVGEYWLGTHSGTPANVARYYSTNQTGQGRIADDTYADGTDDAWPAGAPQAYRISIYAKPVGFAVDAGGPCPGTGGAGGSGGTGGAGGSGGTGGSTDAGTDAAAGSAGMPSDGGAD